MRGQRFTVVAQLTCGHDVATDDLTRLQAEKALEIMQRSAFCETCWKWVPTKTAHSQPTLLPPVR